MTEIRRTVVRQVASSFDDLRGRWPGLLPIVWIGIALSVFQQFVGINVIFYYSTALWQRSASPRRTPSRSPSSRR